MDIRLPIMDGYEAVKIIQRLEKADSDRPKTVLIAQTVSAFEEERVMVIEAGCDDFLRKPFKGSDVFKMMKKHIGIRFIYEDENIETKDQNPITTKNGLEKITPDRLSGLSDALLTRLKQAAVDADMDEVDEIVHEIRTLNLSLPDKLVALADDFEYEKIINAIEGIG